MGILPAMPKTQNSATDYRLDLAFACQPVQLRAALPGQPPETVRFTGVAYSGGVIPNYGWLGDVAIDLASLQNPQATDLPVLVDHDTRINAIAGKGTLSRVGDALHITGELTQATAAGRQITALMAEGYPLQMSVGMQASLREVKGVSTVNGQAMTISNVFEQARILEASFVPTGADPHTSAAQFSAKPLGSGATTPVSATATTKGAVTMTRSAEDQTLIDAQTAQITALTDQLATLQAAQAESATAQRAVELSALFAELGRDLPADTKAYHAMSAEAFTAYAADLRAMKPRNADRALFSSQSAGMAGTKTDDGQDKAKSLLASVHKLSAQRVAA